MTGDQEKTIFNVFLFMEYTFSSHFNYRIEKSNENKTIHLKISAGSMHSPSAFSISLVNRR